MKRIQYVFLLICILLLGGCAGKTMNQSITEAIDNAEKGAELHIEKADVLLLYGNEQKDTSYLIAMNASSNVIYGCIQLEDAYTSIGAYPDSVTKIVINRNEEKDKSMVIDVDNYKVLTLEPHAYIETTTTTKKVYGKDLFEVYRQLDKKPDIYRILRFDSETKVTTDSGEFDFVDVYWIDDIPR